MKKIILSIDGMTCSACSSGLEKFLNKQNGIYDASVNLVMANATIDYDEKLLDIEKLNEFVSKAGFKSLGEFKEINETKDTKAKKVELLLSTIIFIGVMYAHIRNMISGMMEPDKLIMINQFFIALIFLMYGFDVLRNGFKNLVHKTPNMDSLVLISVLSSFIVSTVSLGYYIENNESLGLNYFESVVMIIYFIKLGRFIDSLSKDKTKEAIKKLVKITPKEATIRGKDGKEKVVTLDEIKKGTIVICKPGEKIAVDGEVIEGKTHTDESFITGESKPQVKQKGDKVLAGSISYDGYIEYRAEKIGRESTVSEIVRLVVEATNTKAPIAKIADKVSGIFVPVVILVSILTFIAYLIMGAGFNTALLRFVTILVVACPCALGLATPLAIVVAEGKSAENGILVKKSEIFEIAKNVNTVLFDKTGTLTEGKLKVNKVYNYSGESEEVVMGKICSLEEKSSHPIAKAFKDYKEEKGLSAKKVTSFENVLGHGIVGRLGDDKLAIGNRKMMNESNINVDIAKDDISSLEKDGSTLIFVSDGEKLLGLIGVNDVVRCEAKETVEILKGKKIEPVMLTGDNKQAAKTIGDELGIENIKANILPKEKLEVVSKIREEGKIVMMCGDGINDAPSLTKADIGVSVNSGTDIAMDSSDVILTKNNLLSIINLINISKKTNKIIKENLFWAFIYNIVMIPVAMGLFEKYGVTINPMIGSFAMMLSSIFVVLNSLRIRLVKIK
ncbi:MAG: copper-translocating P-type ATPase [Clostridia bacterium]|nr:copper-translocating P-type ATPase [Bacilli bacterium]MBR3511546.1 copper-translocating P-type ATPase [Clostridia bacterium]